MCIRDSYKLRYFIRRFIHLVERTALHIEYKKCIVKSSRVYQILCSSSCRMKKERPAIRALLFCRIPGITRKSALFLALLVCNCAGCLTCRLARSLTLAAAARLSALLQACARYRLYVLHDSIAPFLNLVYYYTTPRLLLQRSKSTLFLRHINQCVFVHIPCFSIIFFFCSRIDHTAKEK